MPSGFLFYLTCLRSILSAIWEAFLSAVFFVCFILPPCSCFINLFQRLFAVSICMRFLFLSSIFFNFLCVSPDLPDCADSFTFFFFSTFVLRRFARARWRVRECWFIRSLAKTGRAREERGGTEIKASAETSFRMINLLAYRSHGRTRLAKDVFGTSEIDSIIS